LIFGIAAILCLLLGAGGAYFFMKSGPLRPKIRQGRSRKLAGRGRRDANRHCGQPRLRKAQTPSKPNSCSPSPLRQFQVAYTLDGKTRFLTSRFSIPDTTPVMRAELQAKKIFVRDGIYRYLKNSPLSFLDNPQESEKLKTDIAAVINQNIKSGQVSEILIEEYVVQ
jgi:flagellar protein FliL